MASKVDAKAQAAAAAAAESKLADAKAAEVVQNGRFVFPDGATYEGDYVVVAGVPRRQGRGVYADAHMRYEGAWSGDRMSGHGTLVWATGARYEGDFADDEFHGEGVYSWPDGAVYRGRWVRNKMHGVGEYVSGDNVRWTGEFTNGLFFDGKAHIAVR